MVVSGGDLKWDHGDETWDISRNAYCNQQYDLWVCMSGISSSHKLVGCFSSTRICAMSESGCVCKYVTPILLAILTRKLMIKHEIPG